MILDELFIESSTKWKLRILKTHRNLAGVKTKQLYRHHKHGLCTPDFITLVYLEECLALPLHQDQLHNV